MKVAVIGGGIAGCAAAYALATRGAEVMLFERGDIAEAASGNPLGILHPRIEKHWNPVTRFYLSAFYHTQRLLQKLGGEHLWWESPGMLQFPKRRDPAKSEARLREVPVTLGLPPDVARFIEAGEAGTIAGVACSTGALYFPSGTWVSPQEWCHTLIRHPSITAQTFSQVSAIEKAGSGWRVSAKKENYAVDKVIVANAVYAALLFPEMNLPIAISRGQLTFLPPNEMSQQIKTILCYDGYLSPVVGGLHISGSTYEHGVADLTVNAEGHQHNLGLLQRLWPDLFAGLDMDALIGRAALRTITPDRLPLVGEIEEGLYLNIAHGSRGFLSAPLAGELLASILFGEPLPCDADVVAALHPLRFAKE